MVTRAPLDIMDPPVSLECKAPLAPLGHLEHLVYLEHLEAPDIQVLILFVQIPNA